MKSWVKLYNEINRDPKLLTLSWEERGVWAALLALAGEIDDRDGQDKETGKLDTVEYTALRIRCELDRFREILKAFMAKERGLVEDRDGILYLPKYARRQRRPPSASREQTRQRKQDERASQGGHEPVTRASRGVTSPESESESESETETDSERESSVGAPIGAPPAPDIPFSDEPEPEPEESPPRARARRPKDERHSHPAIQAVFESTGRKPPRVLFDKVIAQVGDKPDVARMKAAYEEWLSRGYKPVNMAWLFDWYVNGVPSNGSRASPGKDTKRVTREEELRRFANGNTKGKGAG
jgi:hypothetical protein